MTDPDYSTTYKRFVLAMLTIVYAFNFIDRQILVILQESIKADMGFSDAQLGLLSGFSFALVYVFAGIPIAYLADRSNRRNIIAVALSVWSGMTALSGLAQNYTHLLIARIGVGLGEAGGSPPAHSMISDYYPPERRGTALSIYSAGVYIGILFGFLFGGAIAEHYGWRSAFFIMGIPGILFALFFKITVREPIRGRWETDKEQDNPSFKETISTLRQLPTFWYLAIGSALSAFVGYGNGNFFPSFLIRNHGMTLTEVGITLAITAGFMGAIGSYLGGFLADRLGKEDKRWYIWVPLIGGLLGFFPNLYMLLADDIQHVLICVAFVNLATTTYLGPVLAISHSMVPPAMRALTSAILFFVLNIIGLGLGPLTTGLLSDTFEPIFGSDHLRYAMLVTVLVGGLGMLMFYIASKKLPFNLPTCERQE